MTEIGPGDDFLVADLVALLARTALIIHTDDKHLLNLRLDMFLSYG